MPTRNHADQTLNTSWREVLKGKVVVVGIGNPLRGDDGFGPLLIEHIKDTVSAVCIDAGSAPESYIGKIIKENPDTILLVDAVHLDQEPGAHTLLKKNDILRSGMTTHDLSPSMFIEFLERETHAEIYLLGVQPQDVSFGSEMSPAVLQALTTLSNQLKETLHA